jgi:hypothetical protein
MIEYRSASQILFGYLPDQTVDARGGVWKVTSWRRPIEGSSIDGDALRRELCRLALPWQSENADGGFVHDLLSGRSRVRVKSLDRKLGVELEPFPRIWICRVPGCGRLQHSPDTRCKCGSGARKGQLHFVGYCESCGELREPFIPVCRAHNDTRIIFPGTASGSEIRFQCATCGNQLRKGFGFPACSCGSRLQFTVHRAASVYTPRSVVIVNPPSAQRTRQIEEHGGRARALSWVLAGMQGASMFEVRPDATSLRRQLLSAGLPEASVLAMVQAAIASGAVDEKICSINLPETVAEVAETQAVTIALAVSESRLCVDDMVKTVPPSSPSEVLYREVYPLALEEAGIGSVELIDKFPVLTGHYGYTRGSANPGESRLRAFRERSGDYVVYGDVAETEALFVRLNPVKVASWLRYRGFTIADCDSAESARSVILEASVGTNVGTGGRSLQEELVILVHSFAHRLIRVLAVYAGIERNSLSELLVPLHLGCFIYAAARGDFVLGGLQAVFETDLHRMLNEFSSGEYRCPLDPGCTKGGAACVACLHLGEPSCRYYNTLLDRMILFGSLGYLHT